MSLLSVLKTVGKDLGHVATWVEDALKAVEPVAAIVDPPLAPIIGTVEAVLAEVTAAATKPLTADTVQQVVTSVTTLEMLAPSVLAAVKATPLTLPAVSADVAAVAAVLPKS